MSSMSEYVSLIKFSLNFEDHKNSVQVASGDTILFDGDQAQYTKKDGSVISGRAPSLKSAINLRWLAPKTGNQQNSETANIPVKGQEADIILGNSGEKYDNLRGGSFDEWIAKERKIDKVPISRKIITEKDRTIKETKQIPTEKKKVVANEKLEVAGDQVAVKENVTVNSSTAVPPTRTHKATIKRSEDYGADRSTPIKETKKVAEEKRQNVFTVDDTTPNVPEEATLAEIKRAVIKNEGESQDARVVGTIKQKRMQIETVEGVDLKEPYKKETVTTVEEGVTFKTEKSQARTAKMDGVNVSSGGETPAEIRPGMDGVTVVQKRTGVNIPSRTDQKPDYLSMLPDDWGTMHWTQKEKFIKVLTDKEFLKFILSVETIKAVQDACIARLEELDSEKND